MSRLVKLIDLTSPKRQRTTWSVATKNSWSIIFYQWTFIWAHESRAIFGTTYNNYSPRVSGYHWSWTETCRRNIGLFRYCNSKPRACSFFYFGGNPSYWVSQTVVKKSFLPLCLQLLYFSKDFLEPDLGFFSRQKPNLRLWWPCLFLWILVFQLVRVFSPLKFLMLTLCSRMILKLNHQLTYHKGLQNKLVSCWYCFFCFTMFFFLLCVLSYVMLFLLSIFQLSPILVRRLRCLRILPSSLCCPDFNDLSPWPPFLKALDLQILLMNRASTRFVLVWWKESTCWMKFLAILVSGLVSLLRSNWSLRRLSRIWRRCAFFTSSWR